MPAGREGTGIDDPCPIWAGVGQVCRVQFPSRGSIEESDVDMGR